ncbi:hypothetical protein [Oceanimonas baumannii]|uniref:Flagellar protein FliT n=1 Tax=Oceanimonas baumannii TaxID=129578 RepID=A0A235CN34_9GAMM|nr:hypothetical protein [Oceanimonas baumannii]OYD25794.1 hypothetical protein B6S09_02845 [Oceanimonas baumannii]TDW60195.1 hypothetical protein LY04_01190 [Oceanimonas baumannii]
MKQGRNQLMPAAETPIPSVAGQIQCERSELAPLFARLLILQQRTAQAVQAGQWGWLNELDGLLRQVLADLKPYRSQLNEQQRQLLNRFETQYREHWSRVNEQAGLLEQRLERLREQHMGSLAYDWISQLEDES